MSQHPRILITGAHGTVGRALSDRVLAIGGRPIPWDLRVAPPHHYHAMEKFVDSLAPDAIVHLAIASRSTGMDNEPWLINRHWPGELAWITRCRQIPFLLTSTVMVFTDRAVGPFLPETPPDATEGYGGEKAWAERRVLDQNPEARIVRLGWQIGSDFFGNQMTAWLEAQHREHGVIRPSRLWIPACSLLPDTAEALLRALDLPPGIYHLDGNRHGHNFSQIVHALNEVHGRRWQIEPEDSFQQDQRLLDLRLPARPLSETLPLRELSKE